MDILYASVATGFTLLSSATAYLVGKVLDTDKVVAAHIVENNVLFAAVRDHTAIQEKMADERHQDLKDRLVRITEKLDAVSGGFHA